MSATGWTVAAGLTLPVFDCPPQLALETARKAESAGLDGVFVFDHLGRPGSQVPVSAAECLALLGAVAASTSRVDVGSLVIKSWLRPPEITAAAFETLEAIAPGRVIAGIGISDRMSAGEVERFGLEFPGRPRRVVLLGRTLSALEAHRQGRVWIGGTSKDLLEAALGRVERVNIWNSVPAEVRRLSSRLRRLSEQVAAARIPGISCGADLTFAKKNGGAAFLAEVSASGADYLILSVPRPRDAEEAIDLLREATAS